MDIIICPASIVLGEAKLNFAKYISDLLGSLRERNKIVQQLLKNKGQGQNQHKEKINPIRPTLQ
jgi:hypothetical protein